jgi:hypothetical protein
MSQLFRLPSAVKRDPAIDAWITQHPSNLGEIAKYWFGVMRSCGDDVREVLHDGHPTACIADAAFAYVNAFKAHVNVGFFRGAEIADPEGLLEGTGKFMRHVKIYPAREIGVAAVSRLICAAYADMKARVQAELLQASLDRQSNGK